MARRRRVTDDPSQIVTKGNLDDRLETVNVRTSGHWTLDDERWDAHKALATERWEAHREVHTLVAEALREYKKDANEWRVTLTDLRSSFISRAEYLAEHRALDAKLHGEIIGNMTKIESLDGKLIAGLAALDARIDLVERSIQSINDREVTTRGVLSNGRNLILLVLAIMGGIISLALYFRPG